MILFLSTLTRKSGLSLILFFSYTLIIERIVYYMLFVNVLESSSIGNYLPASIAWFCQPFYMIESNALGAMEDIGNDNVFFMKQLTAIYTSWAYIAIFTGLSLKIFVQRDH